MAFFAALFSSLALAAPEVATAAVATTAATTVAPAVAPGILGTGITATEALFATSVVSGVAGVAKNIEGQRAEDKQNRVARQALNLRAQRQTRRLVRQEQIKRAQIISAGETSTGGGAVSAIQGGLGGLAGATAAEQSLVAQTTALGRQATSAGNQASRSRSQAALFGGIGALATAARRSGLFDPEESFLVEPAITV